MIWIYLLLVGSLVVVAVDAASPGRNGKQLAKLAARMSLPLTREVEPLVRGRLRRRAWGVGLGGGLALAVVLAAGLAVPGLAASPFASVVVFVAAFAGMGLGGAAAAAVPVARPEADAVRVARAAPPRVSDYVGPCERIGPRVVTGLALAAFIVGGSVALTGLGGAFEPLSLGEWVASTAGVTTLVAVAALVAAELAMARLVRRGQPAMSELDLAWDDALRSMALRDLVTAPVVLGFVGVVGPMMVLGDAASGGGAGSLGNVVIGVLGLSIGILFALALGLSVWATTTKPHLHWWRTLWEPRRPAVATTASSSAPASERRP